MRGIPKGAVDRGGGAEEEHSQRGPAGKRQRRIIALSILFISSLPLQFERKSINFEKTKGWFMRRTLQPTTGSTEGLSSSELIQGCLESLSSLASSLPPSSLTPDVMRVLQSTGRASNKENVPARGRRFNRLYKVVDRTSSRNKVRIYMNMEGRQ